MQAGGSAAVLAYTRSTSDVERLFLLRAASETNALAEKNSVRRDHRLASMIAEGFHTGQVRL